MQSYPLPFNFDDFIMAFYGKQMWNYFNACASNFYACFTYGYDNFENCQISEQGKFSIFSFVLTLGHFTTLKIMVA